MPIALEQTDSWMRPEILEAKPKDIKDWVNMRARQGKTDGSRVIFSAVMKILGPGNAEEKAHLMSTVLNPHVCSQPRGA